MHVIEHAGHAPFLTHAEAVTARLVGFLDAAQAEATA
jgi:pimeloyl-ACP methyl ester carboxylesterase